MTGKEIVHEKQKNCLAVLLMTAIVITGCGNQQAEKENPSVVAQKTSSVQNESEDGEKIFFLPIKTLQSPFQKAGMQQKMRKSSVVLYRKMVKALKYRTGKEWQSGADGFSGE